MFLWPLFLCAALIAIGTVIALQPHREHLARAHVVAFLAHEHCPDCERPYGRIGADKLEHAATSPAARPKVFRAPCPRCGASHRVQLRRGSAQWVD